MLAPTAAPSIVARIAGAVLGGYAFTAAFVALSAVLAAHLGMVRGEAVVLASMLGFLVYLTLLIWAFAIKSVVKVWQVTIAGALLMAGLAYALRTAL